MRTDLKTVHEFLNLDQRFLIPLFQRGYAWSLEDQWELLWDDVLLLQSQLLNGSFKPHFLGALVIQDTGSNSPGSLPTWEVVDGQQRLMTLQILADAVSHAIRSSGFEKPARRLRKLTENDPDYRDSVGEIYKLWPTNKDRQAYLEVMAHNEPPDHSALKTHAHRVTRAHRYFFQAAQSLVAETGDAESELAVDALATAIATGLQLVTITLDSGENAQEIFETLNARMTPLQPTDLIKNFLFQKLNQEGENSDAVYLEHWQPLESAFWETVLSQGRIQRQRLTAFFVYWLEMMTLEDVPTGQVFRRFKRFIEQEWTGTTLEALISLRESAAQFEEITAEIESDKSLEGVALSIYRFLAMDLSIFWPVVLWLVRKTSPSISRSDAEAALRHLESWVVRRLVIGERAQAYAKSVVPMLKYLATSFENSVAESMMSYLSSQTAVTSYWPSDERVIHALATTPVYRTLTRARLRVILEAIEDEARGFVSNHARKAHSRAPRNVLQIEHVLPREWEANWPLGELSEADREAHVDLIGNLTILERKFNSSVSNSAWLVKKDAFNDHAIQLLNSELATFDVWDEMQISNRSATLASRFLRLWPAPPSVNSILLNAPKVASSLSRQTVSLRELVDADFLQVGEKLTWYSSAGNKPGPIFVNRDFFLATGDGQQFRTPSEAANKLTGSSYNGWKTWLTGDGVSLWELRGELESLLEEQAP
jgi:hypothetical protein